MSPASSRKYKFVHFTGLFASRCLAMNFCVGICESDKCRLFEVPLCPDHGVFYSLDTTSSPVTTGTCPFQGCLVRIFERRFLLTLTFGRSLWLFGCRNVCPRPGHALSVAQLWLCSPSASIWTKQHTCARTHCLLVAGLRRSFFSFFVFQCVQGVPREAEAYALAVRTLLPVVPTLLPSSPQCGLAQVWHLWYRWLPRLQG